MIWYQHKDIRIKVYASYHRGLWQQRDVVPIWPLYKCTHIHLSTNITMANCHCHGSFPFTCALHFLSEASTPCLPPYPDPWCFRLCLLCCSPPQIHCKGCCCHWLTTASTKEQKWFHSIRRGEVHASFEPLASSCCLPLPLWSMPAKYYFHR